MGHFAEYSKYYNLLYKDKNYQLEADYIKSIIKQFAPESKSLLDIGCGTGKHANLMFESGYDVTGMDLSLTMLEEAKKSFGEKIDFVNADARKFDLGKQFDIITSLFHVMSYQTKSEDIEGAFSSISKNLKKGGYFIFDCWYGPGVLSDPPSVKIKRMEDKELQVTRIGEPKIDCSENLVEVFFDINITRKDSGQSIRLYETHPMRYFFKKEIESLAKSFSFQLVDYFNWLTFQKPNCDTWYCLFVLSKD